MDDKTTQEFPHDEFPHGVSGKGRDHGPGANLDADIPDFDLLKRIGRGSYGQVWLAKSATGSCRAVKIVFRDAFEADKPYEREFKGIRDFEPISRSHPGQLDILHVGRNDEEGFFYYVMELADDDSVTLASVGKSAATDASSATGKTAMRSTSSSGITGTTSTTRPDIDSETYRPRTLQSWLKKRGRLHLVECLELAVSLAEALGHLHANGLVHRDIKPSNIIFVRGRPKLADIGLVAHADEQLSIVGTEGFLPPEGPGKRTADIYGLGKVFYETATGLDRREFPKPPAAFEDSREQKAFIEFNEVILRCCESVVEHRYQSTADLLADLNLLRQGRSVRRLRLVERKLQLLKKLILVGAASLLALGGFGVHLWRTQIAERALNQQLGESNLRLSESRAVLAMQEDRWFNALSWSAATLRDAEGHPEIEARQRYRIGALLQVVPKTVALLPTNGRPSDVHFNSDGRLVFITTAAGQTAIWDIRSKSLVQTLEHPGCERSALSPDGSRFAVADRHGGTSMILFDVAEFPAAPLMRGPPSDDVGFPGSGRFLLASGHPSSGVRLYRWEATSGGQSAEFPSRGFANFWMHPTQPWLVTDFGTTIGYGRLYVWDASAGRPLHPEEIEHYRRGGWHHFSPDGKFLLVQGTRGGIDPFLLKVYRLESGQAPELYRTLTIPFQSMFDAELNIRGVGFLADSRRILVQQPTRSTIWDVETGSIIRTFDHPPATRGVPTFSRDGRLVALVCGTETWLVDGRSGELMQPRLPFGSERPGFRYNDRDFVRFGPERAEGRLMAVMDPLAGTVHLVNVQGLDREIVQTPRQAHEIQSVHFCPDGLRLLTACNDQTARVWDVTDGRPVSLVMAQPEPALMFRYRTSEGVPGQMGFREDHTAYIPFVDAVFSPDGKYVLLLGGGDECHLWTAEGERIAGPFRHENGVDHVEFSADGRHFLTAGADGIVQVRQVPSGEPAGPPLRHGPIKKPIRGSYGPQRKTAFATFHPTKPRLLATFRTKTASVWDWRNGERPLYQLTREGDEFRAGYFSPDGSKIATFDVNASPGDTDPYNTIQVWDAETGEPLTRLFGFDGFWADEIHWTRDSQRLITSGGLEGNTFHVRFWRFDENEPVVDRQIEMDATMVADLSPDGTLLVTATASRIQVWDVATGVPLTPGVEIPGRIIDVTMASDNCSVAVACADGRARVWRFEPFERSPLEAGLLAQYHSGRKIIGDTNLTQLGPEDLVEADKRLDALGAGAGHETRPDSSSDWYHWYRLAITRLQNGETASALATVNEALTTDPAETAPLWGLKGRILGLLGDSHGAIEAFGRVLGESFTYEDAKRRLITTRLFRALETRARDLLERGADEEAMTLLRQLAVGHVIQKAEEDSLAVNDSSDALSMPADWAWLEPETLAAITRVAVPKQSTWRYDDQGAREVEPETDWRAVAFDDGTWKAGRAELGYGDNDEATAIQGTAPDGSTLLTAYFRHPFEVSAAERESAELLLSILCDDGAVVYLNGSELLRIRMPAGDVSYTTTAAEMVQSERRFDQFVIRSDLLRSGRNVLAIEVHQIHANSSDLSFDLELRLAPTLLSEDGLPKALAGLNDLFPEEYAEPWRDYWHFGFAPQGDAGLPEDSESVLAAWAFKARIQIALRRWNEALAAVERALSLVRTDAQRSELRQMKARVLELGGAAATAN